MTREIIRNTVFEILREIVADEFDDIHDNQPFQEQLEIDSMDFLDVIMDLRKTFRINIPEEDYTQLTTMQTVLDYLEPQLSERPQAAPLPST